MKIVVDMNLSPLWVDALTTAGISTVHWSTVGSASAPDTEIMAWACDHGSAVLTQDLDFGTLLALTSTIGPSVIQIRAEDTLPETLTPIVIAAIRQFESELEVGAIVTIDERRSKVRILPI